MSAHDSQAAGPEVALDNDGEVVEEENPAPPIEEPSKEAPSTTEEVVLPPEADAEAEAQPEEKPADEEENKHSQAAE